ncbi:MAG TPA: CDP-glucose 4,6-dehydratase [Solirubrobacteraceae bacterium]|nr:CDP-glucose 4,6-dehydratase [Solirubrobacteraceae bacterium]
MSAVPDPGSWAGRRVLVTGHTGFKGSWLTLWLGAMGAEVTGLSRDVPTEPSLFELARVHEGIRDWRGDVADRQAVADAVRAADPHILLHLAAQPIVRRSFEDPIDTYATNVMGTAHVLDAARHAADLEAVLIVTSDKCYENREWHWGYREEEPLGGHDPYSSSKGAAELVTAAFRRSFFAEPGGPAIASARAGNVVGGGDWGADRLIPDCMRAAAAGHEVRVRNPDAIRPWQHVLNPLSGYLVLVEGLHRDRTLAAPWNFGPADEDARPVRWIADRICERWPGPLSWGHDPGPHPHEAHSLKLDSSRARARLDWAPRWGLAEALDAIVDWHGALARGEDMREVTLAQIEAFLAVEAGAAT